MWTRFTLPMLVFCIASLLSLMACAQAMNGFDLSNATIDVSEIMRGGPPRDGIPSIDDPKFVPADRVDYLQDDDIVLGLVRGETARAYPLRVLIWHEIVNETIEGDAVAVTYCPLCGTAMVFDRDINGKVRSFGVSGLLYRSDVLMYDRESESLWSQLGMKAVAGTEIGADLVWLPSEHMTWAAWRERFPQGEVLSTDTGFRRNYGDEAYASYFASDNPMFPVPSQRGELPDKSLVLGVIIDGAAKAYPVDELRDGMISDNLAGQSYQVRYDAESRHPKVIDANGEEVPSVVVFWFAWQGFYPQTELWTPAT